MLDALPQIPLFAGLETAHTKRLLEVFEAYQCPQESSIIQQGTPAVYLYVILTGRVTLYYKPYDGPEIVLTRLKDGDVFGWSAAVGGSKYSSSVVSETILDAIRIQREELWGLLDQHPDTGRLIIDRLALNVSPRWKNAHEQIEAFLKTGRK